MLQNPFVLPLLLLLRKKKQVGHVVALSRLRIGKKLMVNETDLVNKF